MCSADDLALLDLAVHLGEEAALAREHRVSVMPVPAGPEEAEPRRGEAEAVRKARRGLWASISAATDAALEPWLAKPRGTCGAVYWRAAVERGNVAAHWDASTMLNHAEESDCRHASDVYGAAGAGRICSQR